MQKFRSGVIHHRRAVVVAFFAVAVVCAFMIFGVNINYNMADYLPPTAQSTKAVQIMGEEFTQAVPNASVLVRDVDIPESLTYKEELAALDGVEEVLWLDDMVDVQTPLEMADSDTVEGFYKDGNALFSVTIAEGVESEAIGAIRELIGEENAVAGEAADTDAMRSATGNEVGSAVAILLPAILIILIISTTSWIEPLLFLAAIGVSIVINMGTNLFFGEVSFVTNSVSPILQLAVSLDYAIFLLHSFADFRRETGDVNEAMAMAMKRSMPAVAASALTTLFGFLALSFMNFQIGADLGINLAKGIILSFVSCMVLLPALTLCCYKIIDKTKHRPFMPAFKGIGKLVSKIAIPVTIAVLVLVVPSFLGQSRTNFIYGNGDVANPTSRSAHDTIAVEEAFGKSTVMAVLVPRGDLVKEAALGGELEEIDHVTGVMSFASTVGTSIPADFLDDDITAQFYSENYARIILYTNTPYEGDVAFATVEAVNDKVAQYYDEFYTAGQSANLYDMKSVVAVDNSRVNLIAIIAIFAVLLFTFKSGSLPFLLLFTIEAGIWINLAIPYFLGQSINFLGYLVVNTVQLGATVDYAILLTSYYMDHRKRMGQRAALHTAMGEAFKSILVSAATLTIAGFTLAGTSSNPSVAIIGSLLGRGTVLSFLMVLCLLPVLLTVFDKAIGASTWKALFYREDKNKPNKRVKDKKKGKYSDEMG